MMIKQPDIIQDLIALGLRSQPPELRALLDAATKQRLSVVQCLEQLVTLERRSRDVRNLARRTKEATLGVFKPMDRFDWNHPRLIDREQIEELFELGFIEKGHNILFRGPSGIGKTMLTQNIGHLAVKHGYTVRFVTLAAVLADLFKQESSPALERRLRRYETPALLILDELGYLPCDNKAGDFLYTIISRRHENRSTVITTNLAFKQWGTVFPGAACVGALVDRFVQHCHIIDIDGDSWREKEAKTFVANHSRTRKKTKA